MDTKLIVREKGVPKDSALAQSEHELYEAMSGAFESFYSQGVILNRINIDKEYKDAGFESFADYMNERQPCGIKERQAFGLIAAMKLRPLLPDCTTGAVSSGTWTERAIRPLLHKDFTPADQKRIGKKIATRVKHGEKLTASLVKEICDDERGVERKRVEKLSRELESALTPSQVIEKLWGELLTWKDSLGKVPSDFWKDAEAEDVGCCKKTSAVCSELASFLEAKASRKVMRHASSN